MAQPLKQPRTHTPGSSGVSVGKYLTLDLASKWSAKYMPALERVPMPRLPPDVYNTPEHPIQREVEFYPVLKSSLLAPNEAMKALNVDASLSSSGI